MLKTLTVAILVGLASGRPSALSGQEINIMESKDLIYVYEELPDAQDPTLTQLEEMPNMQPQLQSLLRSKRGIEDTVRNYIERLTTPINNSILAPIEAAVADLANAVKQLVETILGLVAKLLNPILKLLTTILNPILKPLRPLLNPILDPVNTLLTNLLGALDLPLDLSGLLTGNVTSPTYVPATNGSSDSSSEDTEAAQASPAQVSGDSTSPQSMPGLSGQSRRRRASSPNPLSAELSTSRNRRQSLAPSLSSAIGSILLAPLQLVNNILSAIGNVILRPIKLILSPIFSLLRIPIHIISMPFDMIGSILSPVESLVDGIVSRMGGPIQSLVIGVLNFVFALLKGVGQGVSQIVNMPDRLANAAQQALELSSSRTRRDVGISSSGPLKAILSLLSRPLEILSNLLASLLGNFNISYATLQEAARVLFSNAAKRFLVMAYDEVKNVILPGVDNLLQSIVGSEYIPDYLNSAIAQFHTFYRLIRMMGYLRPS